MKILAFEFSSTQRSVAFAESQSGSSTSVAEVVETGAPGGNALAMAQSALAQGHAEREQVECIAVGLGPGSYTGIRAAIALAQGWQLASGVKLLGISSAECIAAVAAGEGISGRIAVVIDAQRNEFYLAEYELAGGKWREVAGLRLTSLSQVEAAQEHGALILGPEVTKWFPSGRMLFPSAAVLAQIAQARSDYFPGENLDPIYLRQTAFLKAPPPRVVPG